MPDRAGAAGRGLRRAAGRRYGRLGRPAGRDRHDPGTLHAECVVRAAVADRAARRRAGRVPAARRRRGLPGHPRRRLRPGQGHPVRVPTGPEHPVRRAHRRRLGLGRGRDGLQGRRGRLDLARPRAVPGAEQAGARGLPGRVRRGAGEPQGPVRGQRERALEGRGEAAGPGRRFRRAGRRPGGVPGRRRGAEGVQGRRVREHPGGQHDAVLRAAAGSPDRPRAAEPAHAAADLRDHRDRPGGAHDHARQAARVRRTGELDVRGLDRDRQEEVRLEGVAAGRPGPRRRAGVLLAHPAGSREPAGCHRTTTATWRRPTRCTASC